MKAACCDVVPLQDSDLKQYWMPDSQCKECYDCNEKFTTFRRRHHCRLCGQIFCSRCCNQEIPGKFMGYTGRVQISLGYECIRKLFVIHQNILHCHFTSSYINVKNRLESVSFFLNCVTIMSFSILCFTQCRSHSSLVLRNTLMFNLNPGWYLSRWLLSANLHKKIIFNDVIGRYFSVNRIVFMSR